jgi:mono/diheme cytochrome c family protein
MKTRGHYTLFLLLLLTAFLPEEARPQSQAEEMIKRGQTIFAIAGGCACHTEPEDTLHAGAREFPVPLGTIYSTNITQDKETGLGNWSDQEIYDSMVKGLRPNGEKLLPVMPYEAYSGMAETDLKALIAYMRTLEPESQKNTPEELHLPFVRSLFTPLWLKFFGRFFTSPATAPKSGIERGRYLTDHVALCGDCHTPRNRLGVPNRDLYLAGTNSGPFDEVVPNITPDQETGIKDWSRDEIADLILKGTKPDLDDVQGLMMEVIQGTSFGYEDMRREDALAIADYLKSIPPIVNKIE